MVGRCCKWQTLLLEGAIWLLSIKANYIEFSTTEKTVLTMNPWNCVQKKKLHNPWSFTLTAFFFLSKILWCLLLNWNFISDQSLNFFSICTWTPWYLIVSLFSVAMKYYNKWKWYTSLLSSLEFSSQVTTRSKIMENRWEHFLRGIINSHIVKTFLSTESWVQWIWASNYSWAFWRNSIQDRVVIFLVSASDSLQTKCFVPGLNTPRGLPWISSDRDDWRILGGLKSSIWGFFWVGNFGKNFFG